MPRILIVGNSGSGKTTLARALAADHGLAHLDLDPLAWEPTPPPTRRSLTASLGDVARFTTLHDAWVIEGCYADLAEALSTEATELIFLNPGVEACERHCRARSWEPHKYASAEAQDRNLDVLIAWVRAYASRDDACSLASHRRLFEAFPGPKRETGSGDVMTNPELQGKIEAARAYDGLFVPSLVGVWAPIVAEAAAIAPGQQVLDVACGTGVLARAAAARCAPGGRVIGVDANAGMLAVAAERAPELTWRASRAETLPFDDGVFDAVVSQFGLMFFDDRVGAIREMLRVLRPGGTLAVAVWDSLANHPAYAAEAALLARMAGDRAAHPLRAPFALGDVGALARLFGDAGADAVGVVTHPGTATFPSVQVVVGADLRGWLPLMGVTLDEPVIAEILAAADDALAPYVTRAPTGGSFATSVHVVRARRA